MKIAVITCYKDPDYIRAKTLRAALENRAGDDVIVIKNRHRSLLLRVPEIYTRILWLRYKQNPDVYLVTFRGYELLPWVLLLAGSRPVIFDEFINPLEVVAEHRRMKAGSLVGKLMAVWNILGNLYYWLLKHCRFILTDTDSHADYSAGLSRLPRDKYVALPVGADEDLFVPSTTPVARSPFMVFYYGNMLPLHGLEHVIEAARLLKDRPIDFLIAGGGSKAAETVEKAVAGGARITYQRWIPFKDLPTAMQQSNLVLGGPFGKTVQSQLVITGKTYQALAAGVPVLIGKTAVQSGLIDKQNCLIVNQADARAIAEAVDWAAKHPREMTEIAAHGHALYNDEFSVKIIRRRLDRLLNEIAAQPASHGHSGPESAET